jgi:hypothetical protein
VFLFLFLFVCVCVRMWTTVRVRKQRGGWSNSRRIINDQVWHISMACRWFVANQPPLVLLVFASSEY